MIKSVRFSLTFYGRKANTLEELKEYFSIDIVEHYKNGSLLRWLNQRDLQNEISTLKSLNNTPIEDLYSKLAEAFCIDRQLSDAEKEKLNLTILMQKADAGDSDAQFRLAECYFNGFGIEENKSKAVIYYKLAAGNGHHFAINALGHCYENGFGINKDIVQARTCYQKTANFGDQWANIKLDKIKLSR